ncbi:unnamed protein product [Nezara viridula]|uniref:Peptidase S1 domain-containing protein n=1 Tax=Nezara viridula TaxID=85310 RepID=A0A9P0HEP6_NEZVI|nr:unnamed protein product [Nezara viridula]
MEISYFIWIGLIGSLLTVSDCYLSATAKDKFVPENHKHWNNLEHRTCGFSLKNRIIGGRSVRLGKYPWLVRLGKLRSASAHSLRNPAANMVFPCGGAILNRLFILTAGHCFLDPKSLPTTVRAGEFDTSKEIDCHQEFCAPPVQDIRIKEYYTPRYFKPNSMENDIALVLLSKPIEFSEVVAPICMPTFSLSKSNLTGKSVEVAGWGLTNIYTRKTPTVLHSVTLKVVENTWCKMYKEKHSSFPFNIICAGNESGKDSCSGDSGGPLMLPVNEHGTIRYYVVGVVSYGPEACGETNSPGIYTYLAQFEQWILNLINTN